MVLSVVMKDGIMGAGDDEAVDRTHEPRDKKSENDRQRNVAALHAVHPVEKAAHGHHGSHGQIKLTSDHQHCNADGDHSGNRRGIHDARYGPHCEKVGDEQGKQDKDDDQGDQGSCDRGLDHPAACRSHTNCHGCHEIAPPVRGCR